MECILCGARAAPFPCAEAAQTYLKCVSCDLVWLAPAERLPPARERSRYEEHLNLTTDERYQAYLGRLAAEVVGHVRVNARGLDFGSGPAEGMRAILAPSGFSVSSYDPYFFPREELLAESYDFVLCSEAAEHFYSPAKSFRAIDRCLRAGGLLAVSSHLRPADDQFAAWWYRKDPTHVSFYSARTVAWLARHFHWKIVTLNNPHWVFKKAEHPGIA